MPSMLRTFLIHVYGQLTTFWLPTGWFVLVAWMRLNFLGSSIRWCSWDDVGILRRVLFSHKGPNDKVTDSFSPNGPTKQLLRKRTVMDVLAMYRSLPLFLVRDLQ